MAQFVEGQISNKHQVGTQKRAIAHSPVIPTPQNQPTPTSEPENRAIAPSPTAPSTQSIEQHHALHQLSVRHGDRRKRKFKIDQGIGI